MKILAIDIGAGTQDILLFDSAKKIENCISLVLPTPSKFIAEKLKGIDSDVYICGNTIGGGSLIRAVLNHLKKGCRVVMEESAAYSIRNDLDEVKSMGIEVGEDPGFDHFQKLETREIDLPILENFVSNFGENLRVDVIAIAVHTPGTSESEPLKVTALNLWEASGYPSTSRFPASRPPDRLSPFSKKSGFSNYDTVSKGCEGGLQRRKPWKESIIPFLIHQF
jgi:hypothetical protein